MSVLWILDYHYCRILLYKPLWHWSSMECFCVMKTLLLYSKTGLRQILNKTESCINRTINKSPNVGNLCKFNLHKSNTCLLRTQKLIQRKFRFGQVPLYQLYKPHWYYGSMESFCVCENYIVYICNTNLIDTAEVWRVSLFVKTILFIFVIQTSLILAKYGEFLCLWKLYCLYL